MVYRINRRLHRRAFERGEASIIAILLMVVLLVSLAAGLGFLAAGALKGQASLEARRTCEENARAGFPYGRRGFTPPFKDRVAGAISAVNQDPNTDWPSMPIPIMGVNIPDYTFGWTTVPGEGRTSADRVRGTTHFTVLPPQKAREQRPDGVTNLYQDEDPSGWYLFRVAYETRVEAESRQGARVEMVESGEASVAFRIAELTDDQVAVAYHPDEAPVRFLAVADDSDAERFGPRAPDVAFEPCISFEEYRMFVPHVTEEEFRRLSQPLGAPRASESTPTVAASDTSEGAEFLPVRDYYGGVSGATLCNPNPSPVIVSASHIGVNSKGGVGEFVECKFCGDDYRLSGSWSTNIKSGTPRFTRLRGDGWRLLRNYDCNCDCLKIAQPGGGYVSWQPPANQRNAAFLVEGPNMQEYTDTGTTYTDCGGHSVVGTLKASNTGSGDWIVTNRFNHSSGPQSLGVSGRAPNKITIPSGAPNLANGGQIFVDIVSSTSISSTAVARQVWRWQDYNGSADPTPARMARASTSCSPVQTNPVPAATYCPEGYEPPFTTPGHWGEIKVTTNGDYVPGQLSIWMYDPESGQQSSVSSSWDGKETPSASARRLNLVTPPRALVVWSGRKRWAYRAYGIAGDDDPDTTSVPNTISEGGDGYDPVTWGGFSGPTVGSPEDALVETGGIARLSAGNYVTNPPPPPPPGPPRYGIAESKVAVVALAQQRIPASAGATSALTSPTPGADTHALPEGTLPPAILSPEAAGAIYTRAIYGELAASGRLEEGNRRRKASPTYRKRSRASTRDIV